MVVAIICILIGHFNPSVGVHLKPFGNTLPVVGNLPVESLALIFNIDRFVGEAGHGATSLQIPQRHW